MNGQDGCSFHSGLINALQLKMACGSSVYVNVSCAAEVVKSSVKPPNFTNSPKVWNMIQSSFRNVKIFILMGAEIRSFLLGTGLRFPLFILLLRYELKNLYHLFMILPAHLRL